jgi:hypothetical protein
MTEPRFPQALPADASAAQARRWVRQLVLFVGTGFHPDTPFDDYVRSDGIRSFTPEQCQALEAGLKTAWEILDRAGMDIYTVAFRAHRLLLRRESRQQDASES